MKRLALLVALLSSSMAFAQIMQFDGLNVTGSPAAGSGYGCTQVPGGCRICGLVSGPIVTVTCPSGGSMNVTVPMTTTGLSTSGVSSAASFLAVDGGFNSPNGQAPILVGFLGTAVPLSPRLLDGGFTPDGGTLGDGGWMHDGGFVPGQVSEEIVAVGFDQGTSADAGFVHTFAVAPVCGWSPTYTDGGGAPSISTTTTGVTITALASVTDIGNAFCYGQ